MGRGKMYKGRKKEGKEVESKDEKRGKEMERKVFFKGQDEREGFVKKEQGDKERKGQCGFKVIGKVLFLSLQVEFVYLVLKMLIGGIVII